MSARCAAIALALSACAAQRAHPVASVAPSHRVAILAHRGGAALYPEETLLAMRETAARFPSAVLDADIQLSADGVPVLLHDDTVDRTTDGTGRVDALTLAQLLALDAGYCFSPDLASNADCRRPPPEIHFPFRAMSPTHLTIATLDELFDAFPAEQPLHLEVKPATPGVGRRVAELLRQHHRVEHTCVGSFVESIAHEIRAALAEGCVWAPMSAVDCLHVAVDGQGDARGCEQWSVLDVPYERNGAHYVTDAFVRAAHARHARVQVWTVNDTDTMRALIALGVDGIFTDRPDRLAEVLGVTPSSSEPARPTSEQVAGQHLPTQEVR